MQTGTGLDYRKRKFEDYLKTGQMGESKIAMWLRRKGFAVLPVYEVEIDTGKGPRLFGPDSELIAPDMLVFREGRTLWVEAKNKTAFTWHRISGQWTTGIDLRHYLHYCEVEDKTPFEVWLLFLQNGGQAKDSPARSPSGLFGGRLSNLRQCEHHRHANWGSSGMVYWSIDTLTKLAELCEVDNA